MSAYRYWQLRTGTNSLVHGMTAILISYTPSMIYYRSQLAKESFFIKDLSDKYQDRIDDGKLQTFINALPKQEGGGLSFTGSRPSPPKPS